jgi:hypothetical protein
MKLKCFLSLRLVMLYNLENATFDSIIILSYLYFIRIFTIKIEKKMLINYSKIPKP